MIGYFKIPKRRARFRCERQRLQEYLERLVIFFDQARLE
jgi:hypothetical protein